MLFFKLNLLIMIYYAAVYEACKNCHVVKPNNFYNNQYDNNCC